MLSKASEVFTEPNLESNVKLMDSQRDHVRLMLAAQGAV